ncbi:conserved hypothetical protein [Candidatus Accumulibacter aalborgensis]|uniref:Uncharacterized protein n=1 Tax=Candidatus Accumulibacter aalborgensis TaxID=1860102 RepID=A0A1A8XJZ2_9PROT|nr:conserved hypothetical protein [Candidatus Accumulibacter aalborgensis]
MAHFEHVKAGMSKDEVLCVISPSGSQWTQSYPRSNALACSWLFCNSWSSQEFFDVMFDATSGIVRSTGLHPVGGTQPPPCGQ